VGVCLLLASSHASFHAVPRSSKLIDCIAFLAPGSSLLSVWRALRTRFWRWFALARSDRCVRACVRACVTKRQRQ
jgi:hypothetical protein